MIAWGSENMQIRIRIIDTSHEKPQLIDLSFPFAKITHLWVQEDTKDPEKKKFLKEYKLVETGEKVNLLFDEGLK